ncbi:RNA ligase family protein [Nonomuraea sp. NPDC026600]|uniref:RNA ligase family protein n=1 Tax=Nonomuraea sp. NPDC026600 TaxID=3155363 RepID=UPI0033E33B3D
MPFPLDEANQDKLNTLTKYPSIPTHHVMDRSSRSGQLTETPTVYDGPALLSEKADGVNVRMTRLPDDDWLIGLREEWLTARGDRVPSRDFGAVKAVKDLAARIEPQPGVIVTLYVEVFGSKDMNAWQNYGDGTTPFVRLFDVSVIDMGMLELDREQLSRWRKKGGQPFLPEDDLQAMAARVGVELTPRLAEIDGADLPGSVDGMRAFLEPYRTTRLAASGISGFSEGVVIRTPDRAVISKARFQDYDKTIRIRAESDRLARKQDRTAAHAAF